MDTVLVPVRDAGGRRVAGYAKIDPGSDWIRDYPWHRLTDDGEAVTSRTRPPPGARSRWLRSSSTSPTGGRARRSGIATATRSTTGGRTSR